VESVDAKPITVIGYKANEKPAKKPSTKTDKKTEKNTKQKK
jgi:hypothetical protein